MNKKVRSHLLNILFVLALLGITVFVLLKSNDELSWADVKDFFANCNAWYILAAVAGMVLFLVAEALSLKNIARKFGYKTKFFSALAYSSADAYYSALTPSATGGQPASAYYMVKDGIDGGATTFTLLFNLLGYTAAIFVLGVSAFVVSLFTSTGSWVFFEFSLLSKIFIIVGVVMQVFLVWLFMACLSHPGAVLRVGNALIALLSKIKLTKKPDELREKLRGLVQKYRSCGEEIKKNRGLFLQTLLFNILQRGAQVAITAFVFKAAEPQTDMIHVFALQCFVLIGYNSMPLPGGSGIFELLYLDVFSTVLFFDKPFLTVAVMVTRVISYYGCMLVSGGYTLAYHVYQNNRKGRKETVREAIEGIAKSDPLAADTLAERIGEASARLEKSGKEEPMQSEESSGESVGGQTSLPEAEEVRSFSQDSAQSVSQDSALDENSNDANLQ